MFQRGVLLRLLHRGVCTGNGKKSRKSYTVQTQLVRWIHSCGVPLAAVSCVSVSLHEELATALKTVISFPRRDSSHGFQASLSLFTAKKGTTFLHLQLLHLPLLHLHFLHSLTCTLHFCTPDSCICAAAHFSLSQSQLCPTEFFPTWGYIRKTCWGLLLTCHHYLKFLTVLCRVSCEEQTGIDYLSLCWNLGVYARIFPLLLLLLYSMTLPKLVPAVSEVRAFPCSLDFQGPKWVCIPKGSLSASHIAGTHHLCLTQSVGCSLLLPSKDLQIPYVFQFFSWIASWENVHIVNLYRLFCSSKWERYTRNTSNLPSWKKIKIKKEANNKMFPTFMRAVIFLLLFSCRNSLNILDTSLLKMYTSQNFWPLFGFPSNFCWSIFEKQKF